MSANELLVRRAFVMTMDPALGDLPDADVHVRDGAIAAVGRDLRAPDAEIIDGREMIALPGLVDTHWHVWTTLLRSMAGDRPEHGYFPTSRGIGVFYTPTDVYRATRLAAAEAIDSGITHIHDWCHNVRSPAHAEASLAALAESGIRARFGYGWPTAKQGSGLIDLDDLERLARGWPDYSAGGRLTLGLAWPGPAAGKVEAAAERELRKARELGLPASVHANASQAAAGGIAALARSGLLAPDLQIIHAIWTTEEEVEALAASGAAVSVSPFTELRIGFGIPTTLKLLAAGVKLGLSVDTPALSGNADPFAIMKAVQNLANGQAGDERALPARRVLALGTLEGARSIGMDHAIGSLTPGKRADMILLDTRRPNLAVLTDAAHLVVEAVHPGNVDTVIVDGRVLKRAGRLTTLDVETIVAEARESNRALRERAGWW
ncbi:MAG TPA: amidohydrolase family protein [Gammaproteobacteria bacterium]